MQSKLKQKNVEKNKGIGFGGAQKDINLSLLKFEQKIYEWSLEMQLLHPLSIGPYLG